MKSVTVLTTVYNGLPYIREAVDSVLAQDFGDFEFLLVDDGSADGTKEFLRSLRDPRIHLLDLEENVGRTSALNLGLGRIKTPYTALLDADDLARKDRLRLQADRLESDPDLVLVASDVQSIDTEGRVLKRWRIPADHEGLLEELPRTNLLAHSSCMFRTEVAQKLGLYPADYVYAQDMALWIRFLQAGYRIASIPEPLASVRTHGRRLSNTASLQVLRREEGIRLSQGLTGLPGISRPGRQAALLRCALIAFSIRQVGRGVGYLWESLKVSPLGFPFNRTVWRLLVWTVIRPEI